MFNQTPLERLPVMTFHRVIYTYGAFLFARINMDVYRRLVQVGSKQWKHKLETWEGSLYADLRIWRRQSNLV